MRRTREDVAPIGPTTALMITVAVVCVYKCVARERLMTSSTPYKSTDS